MRAYEQPLVMGILNITPDSFYTNSRVQHEDELIKRAELMLSEGADILDVGGYSSRPGAVDIPVQEELARVIPAIQKIHERFPAAVISVDTFRGAVADEALKNGASVVNDISGGRLDEEMFTVAAHHNAPYILMHMRGTPQDMSTLTSYRNLVNEIIFELSVQVQKAKTAGVKDLIIDPGFGFSKTIDQNFELMNKLQHLTILGFPLLVGISRKSTIYKTLGISPGESLNGTTVMNTAALLKGASILRVHDVNAAVEAVRLVQAISASGGSV